MGCLVKIRFGEGETGWAEQLPGDRYRIDNIPLEDDLNVDDVVRCRRNEQGELEVSEVLERKYPRKVAVRYERVEQYRALRDKVREAGGQIEGMVGPRDGRPGFALVAHGHNFDALEAAREVGIENPEWGDGDED
jgi:hypothetical protein